MQAERYEPHDIDLLFRRQIESRLVREMERRDGYESAVFDCKEFGLCYMRWSQATERWIAEWYKRTGRSPKPRIAVSVTITDKQGRQRRRWHFAMSKLGFLYPVAYEERGLSRGIWALLYRYESWAKKTGLLVPEERVVPDDAICREAERLYVRRKK